MNIDELFVQVDCSERFQQHILHNSFQSKLIQIHPCAPGQQRLFDATRTCEQRSPLWVEPDHTKGHRAKPSNHCYFSAVRHMDTHGMSQNSGLQGNPRNDWFMMVYVGDEFFSTCPQTNLHWCHRSSSGVHHEISCKEN